MDTSAYEMFTREMRAFRRDFGVEDESRAYVVLTMVIEWLRREGHGTLTLSAKEHRLALTMKADTVVTAGERRHES